jgi:hypothetical protein
MPSNDFIPVALGYSALLQNRPMALEVRPRQAPQAKLAWCLGLQMGCKWVVNGLGLIADMRAHWQGPSTSTTASRRSLTRVGNAASSARRSAGGEDQYSLIVSPRHIDTRQLRDGERMARGALHASPTTRSRSLEEAPMPRYAED